jgi:hypothetical protein
MARVEARFRSPADTDPDVVAGSVRKRQACEDARGGCSVTDGAAWHRCRLAGAARPIYNYSAVRSARCATCESDDLC